MATVAVVTTPSPGFSSLSEWTLTTTNLDGAPISIPGARDRSVIAFASAWGAATLVIQGSNDGTNWATLHDESGVALSFTAGVTAHAIVENFLYIRPFLSVAGSGATITASILSGRTT